MHITPRFIVICHEAFLTAGSNNLNLINVFTQINADKFPFVSSHFALVVSVDIDTGGNHVLHTQVLDPTGAQVARMEMPVTTQQGNWQVIANFERLQFAVPGMYTFRVSLDGIALGERQLAVRPLMSASNRKPNIA